MSFIITGDVCQMIVSGEPIHNYASYMYYNELTGPTGIIYKNDVATYQNTVSYVSGVEIAYTYRWDDYTYYG